MRAVLHMAEAAQDWSNAATIASNLSETELLLGEIAAAVATAETSVALADRAERCISDDVSSARPMADALHAAANGKRLRACSRTPSGGSRSGSREYPLLYSVRGYQYCDLLLWRGQAAEARDRAARPWSGGRHKLGFSAPRSKL